MVAFLVYNDVVAVRGGGGGGAAPLSGGRGGGDVRNPFEGVERGGGGVPGGGTGGGGGAAAMAATFALLCTAAASRASKLLVSITLTWMGLCFHAVLPLRGRRRHGMNVTSVEGLLVVFHTKLKVVGLNQEVPLDGDSAGTLPGMMFC